MLLHLRFCLTVIGHVIHKGYGRWQTRPPLLWFDCRQSTGVRGFMANRCDMQNLACVLRRLSTRALHVIIHGFRYYITPVSDVLYEHTHNTDAIFFDSFRACLRSQVV